MAQKLIAIAYGTGELMRDAPMFDAHIRRIFGLEIGWKLDLAVIAGTGAGTPLGILESPALISVAKETGQAAATITGNNIAAMWKCLPAPSRKSAVWLVMRMSKSSSTISAAALRPRHRRASSCPRAGTATSIRCRRAAR
jgi:HK97 family phage major capsid protein